MKTLALSIGMLFSLAQLHANPTPQNKISGLFFDRYYVTEENKQEDILERRIVLECDVETLDAFRNFEAIEVQVILPNGETIKSALYLKDFELKIKVKDELLSIGVVIEKRVALLASVQANTQIEDGRHLLQLSLATLKP